MPTVIQPTRCFMYNYRPRRARLLDLLCALAPHSSGSEAPSLEAARVVRAKLAEGSGRRLTRSYVALPTSQAPMGTLRQNAQRAALRAAGQATSGKRGAAPRSPVTQAKIATHLSSRLAYATTRPFTYSLNSKKANHMCCRQSAESLYS